MSKKMKIINREHWLTEAAKIAAEHLFEPNKYTVPSNIRYTVSLPSRRAFGAKNQTIGQCWSDTVSKDGSFEIFISPTLDDDRTVFATLVHEMVHATVGLAAGHKAPFKQCALAVGLEGMMTATTMSDNAWNDCKPLLEKLGKFPHAAMSVNKKAKKQTTRMIKLQCYECAYGPVRASRKLIETARPICPECWSEREELNHMGVVS